jgi:NADPH2:quinone reductase
MKAVWYERQGAAAEVLHFGELPTPEPAAGELRVRLQASAVNPADANRRSGLRHAMAYPRIIPNSDGAGVIDAVGEGVDSGRIGQRVWLTFAQRGRPFGTAAEYVCVPPSLVSPLPEHLSFDEGACLGIPCMSAWCALFGDSAGAGAGVGRRVLVTGGAGAVGHYAVQLAKWAGATVVATVSSSAKADHARRAGADAVVDYTRPGAAEAVLEATGGAGVDRVVDVDAEANAELVLRCAADGAVWVAYAVDRDSAAAPLALDRLIRKNLQLRGLYLSGLGADLRLRAQQGVNRWLAEAPAALHTVDRRFALHDTALAHRAVEQGRKLGTVVVRCDPSQAVENKVKAIA